MMKTILVKLLNILFLFHVAPIQLLILATLETELDSRSLKQKTDQPELYPNSLLVQIPFPSSARGDQSLTLLIKAKMVKYMLKIIKRFAEQEQVADDGQWIWPWWEVLRRFSGLRRTIENKFKNGDGDGDQDKEPGHHR